MLDNNNIPPISEDIVDQLCNGATVENAGINFSFEPAQNLLVAEVTQAAEAFEAMHAFVSFISTLSEATGGNKLEVVIDNSEAEQALDFFSSGIQPEVMAELGKRADIFVAMHENNSLPIKHAAAVASYQSGARLHESRGNMEPQEFIARSLERQGTGYVVVHPDGQYTQLDCIDLSGACVVYATVQDGTSHENIVTAAQNFFRDKPQASTPREG